MERTSFCGQACQPLQESGIATTTQTLGHAAQTIKCSKCSYTRFDPLPSDGQLAEYYNQHYWKDEVAKDQANRDYACNWRGFLGELKHYIREFNVGDPESALRFHDVGCSFGAVATFMGKNGWNATGTDISENAIRIGREGGGQNIEASDIESYLTERQEQFDLFYMSHSLEHMIDPVAQLKLLGEHLTPKGLIVIRVPNGLYLPAWRRRMAENYWWYYPEHIHYFTPKSVLCLAKAAGLKVLSVTSRAREDVPANLADTLVGMPHGQMPNFNKMLVAIADNLLSCELQVIFTRGDNPQCPRAGLEDTIARLGDETIQPMVPVVPALSALDFLPPNGDSTQRIWDYHAAVGPEWTAESQAMGLSSGGERYEALGLTVTRYWMTLVPNAQVVLLHHCHEEVAKLCRLQLDLFAQGNQDVAYQAVVLIDNCIVAIFTAKAGQHFFGEKFLGLKSGQTLQLRLRAVEGSPGRVIYALALTEPDVITGARALPNA